MVEVVYTDEFGEWYEGLDDHDQEAVWAAGAELERRGVSLGFPRSSQVKGSKHGSMRELRIQSRGRPLRVFYAFDLRRNAVLLIGGDKTGDDRFYEHMVVKADAIFDEYLEEQRAGLHPEDEEDDEK